MPAAASVVVVWVFLKSESSYSGKIAHVILPLNAGKIYSTLNVTQAALCTY